MTNRKNFLSAATFVFLTGTISFCAAGTITGASDNPARPMQWHKVTLTIDGPLTSEEAQPNPFLDYRMNVTFTHPATETKYVIPGYYAADGNAADSSASSGNKWRAHLCPDYDGVWHYTVSFRQGKDVAVGDSATAGNTMPPYDGISGSFKVAKTDKVGRDMRAKGRLEYVGKHFLRFAGSGEYFFKQGADAPENFLAYKEFDGSFKTDGHNDARSRAGDQCLTGFWRCRIGGLGIGLRLGPEVQGSHPKGDD